MRSRGSWRRGRRAGGVCRGGTATPARRSCRRRRAPARCTASRSARCSCRLPQLLAHHDLVVFDAVEVFDPRDLFIAAALIEADRRREARPRARLDQQHASILPPYFILYEPQKELSKSLPLMPRVDRNPIEVEHPLGSRCRTITDVALNDATRPAVRRLENGNDVLAVLGIVERLVDELHRPTDLLLGETRDAGEDLGDARAIRCLRGTDLHARRRCASTRAYGSNR